MYIERACKKTGSYWLVVCGRDQIFNFAAKLNYLSVKAIYNTSTKYSNQNKTQKLSEENKNGGLQKENVIRKKLEA